jgi:hypothetical protein
MSRELELARELVRKLEEAEKTNKVQLSELQPGETFKIGKHDFIVLEQNGCNGTTNVISKSFMAKDIVFGNGIRDYNKSNLKRVIEENIQPVIESEIGVGSIIEQMVNLTSVDMQDKLKPYYCKVRPITFNEARKYNNLLFNKGLDDWWWTCTPWSTADRSWECAVAVVSPSGIVDYRYCDFEHGVRPFCILKSNIFVSKGE